MCVIFLEVFVLACFATEADDFFNTCTDLREVPSWDLSYFSPFVTDKQVIMAKNYALAEFSVSQVFDWVVNILFICQFTWSMVAQLISWV